MKVILVMATSVDGRTTKWHNAGAYTWVSKEDQKYFFSLLQQQTVIIMGSQTYLDARPVIKLSAKTLRVVMTRNPKKYQKFAVPGQLEFSSQSPQELLQRLEKNGHTQAVLVVGETLATHFVQENLVNEIWLTVEPVLFGMGKNIVSKEKIDIHLQLIGIEKLNKQGTLLVKYSVL